MKILIIGILLILIVVAVYVWYLVNHNKLERQRVQTLAEYLGTETDLIILYPQPAKNLGHYYRADTPDGYLLVVYQKNTPKVIRVESYE